MSDAVSSTSDPLHYFMWNGTQLYRTTEFGEQQGRWDPEAKKWVDSGFLAYDKGFMNPDPDFVEVETSVAQHAFPEAMAEETANLLSKFEAAAANLGEGDKVTLSQSEQYRDLIALAQEILDATAE